MPQPNADFPSQVAGEAGELRLLAQRLVQRDDADDLAQDAIVRALTHKGEPRSLRPWLRQVLRYQYLSSARREYRRRRVREHAMPSFDPPVTPDQSVQDAQIAAAVAQALLELDEPYQDVLRQRFLSDRTAGDIARIEGCPAGTVRWRVQEGLRRMRRTLDERFDGRKQWLGGVALFAGVPPSPSSAPPPPGAGTMTNLTILKVLATTLVVAGGSALALSLNGPQVAADHTAASDRAHHASAQTVVASDGAPARAATALRRAKSASVLAARSAEGNATSTIRHTVVMETAPDNAEAALPPGAPPSGPRLGIRSESNEAVQCLTDLGLDPGEEIEFVLQLDSEDDGTRFITDMEFLHAKHKDLPGLDECIQADLPLAIVDAVPADMQRVFAAFSAVEAKDKDKPTQAAPVDPDADDPQEVVLLTI